ncbi:hypothetical protein STEG23_035255 [Scotinomys teguina]
MPMRHDVYNRVVVVHAFNPSNQEGEASGILGVRGQPCLQRDILDRYAAAAWADREPSFNRVLNFISNTLVQVHETMKFWIGISEIQRQN